MGKKLLNWTGIDLILFTLGFQSNVFVKLFCSFDTNFPARNERGDWQNYQVGLGLLLVMVSNRECALKP